MENAKVNTTGKEQGDATGGIIPYKNVPALISYYLGIFAVIPFLGIFLGIAALILGIMGLKQKKERPAIKGTVHAWIGIICGGIFATLWLLLFLVVVMIPK